MSDTFRDIVLNRLFGGGREPSPQPHRTPADVALGSPLGGPYIPSDMSNMNPTVLDMVRETYPNFVPRGHRDPMWYEPEADVGSRDMHHDQMQQLASRLWAAMQPPQTGYGGTTPGSGVVDPRYASAYPEGIPPQGMPLPPGISAPPGIDYSGGGGGVTANDVNGQFGPVVVGSQYQKEQPPDALLQFLRGLQGR